MVLTPTVLPPGARGRGVTAVLGPTNTGKTHLAIERMAAHGSGIIGLPLRLLAREVYARLVDRLGVSKVALVTGEEKIKPPDARFWVSTIEAMPQDIDVDFVALDEIQLAANLDRGHVFTDRLLNRRGRAETLVLGAATMRPMIEQLLPGATITTRPRLSELTFTGERKLTRLPRRSAIVAFSANEVYAIAELIRRQRGGAAVVMGALSPRTRNAQVDLYQQGDVDYLVATDAIGMGLNLDVDHVAFAADRKFDGFQFRRLNPAEFGQIAGRAGRHMRNGTFGTTGRCDAFGPELVERLQNHNFEPVRLLQWRNTALDYASPRSLIESLSVPPRETGLTRAPNGEDVIALESALQDAGTMALARGHAAVRRLWEACQVPDYRKVSPAAHAELITTLYGFLMRGGTLPEDWFARQVQLCGRYDGDIDTLSARIAHIRTWTFVANRPDWLADPQHWQDVTRGVEDRLSDALHETLTQRFVDRRTSVLMRRLREKTMLEAEVTSDGSVLVEGQHVGRLSAFRFTPDVGGDDPNAKALRAAAQKALAGELEARVEKLSVTPDGDIVLSVDGTLRWLGEPVGMLAAGDRVMTPQVRLLADDTLSAPDREKAENRLTLWMRAYIHRLLGPLLALETAEDLSGIARGVAFQVVEELGVLDRPRVAEEVKGLDQDARASLRKYGIRFGAFHIYMPVLLKPAPRALAAQLWALHSGGLDIKGLDEIPALAASGRTSFAVDQEVPKALYRALGYRASGQRAVRIDILERLADLIRPAIAYHPGVTPGEAPAGAADGNGFQVTVAMTSLVGCAGEDFAAILRSLGYRVERRPAPPEEKTGTETPAAEAPAEAPAETSTEAPTTEEAAPAPEAAPSEEAPEALAEPAAEAASEPVAEEPAATEAAPASDAEAAPEALEATEATDAAEAEAEPRFIEIWRPGRQAGGRPRREEGHRKGGGRRDGHKAQGGSQAGSQGGDGERSPDERRGNGRGPRPQEGRHPRPGNKHGENRHGESRRGENRRPEKRDRAPDPDSPFAALASLKASLDSDKPRR